MLCRILQLALFLFLCLPVVAQHITLPTDGNGVLEFCGDALAVVDNQPPKIDQRDLIMHTGWCSGYVGGIVETYQLGSGVLAGKLDSTEKGLMGVCIPNVTNAQVMRVFVKWLREHPTELHRPSMVLSIEILHDGFPCHPTK